MISTQLFTIHDALDRYGGFVRYYDTTEPMRQLAKIISTEACTNILACCGGGNQALTILGSSPIIRFLYAVDTNEAQLFTLAGKALFLKEKRRLPSFKELTQTYPGKIAAVKKNIRRLFHFQLQHSITKKKIMLPQKLSKSYSLIIDDGLFVLAKDNLFWQKEPQFISQICNNVNRLRFIHGDIFDCSNYFRKGFLDVIYLSDIYWQEKLDYYQIKARKLVDLLCLGGRVICHIDPGDEFMGKGISPGQIFKEQAKQMHLQFILYPEVKDYLVFKRMKKA